LEIVKSRDAPDIQPDNPAFFISDIRPDTGTVFDLPDTTGYPAGKSGLFYIRYPAGYRILKISGYPADRKIQLL
jgi:hypothetical protein